MDGDPVTTVSSRSRRYLAGPLALIALAVIAGSVFFMVEAGRRTARAPSSAPIRRTSWPASSCSRPTARAATARRARAVVTGAPPLVNVGAAAADFYLTTGRMPLNDPGNEALRHHP